ncbi:hypothetical protein AALP_AA4G073600 [Arabis alpina]|uniref:GH3 C-terminal domain-containing protein n=1 Tax=Arabis alpina TaxID=50452 RepID=A0A087H1R8_ARAAL|nr:hypothetical protein AALP_AA4G073600 [Arabis alpina]
MKQRFNPNDLEELTSNAKQIQDYVLKEILTLNANTEYLQRFLHESSDKELFKKNVPVVSYDDVRPYIERVANGEPSNVISGKPITGFIRSSGTSGGKQKIFPVNNKFFEDTEIIYSLRSSIISKHIEGVKNGKALTFYFARGQSTTPSGLYVASGITSYLLSDYFKNRPSNCFTSPDEVTLCPDNKQALYCHLLCGLVQRDQVVSVTATFGSILVGAITFLENHWKEMCSNIRTGHVSDWITDLICRDAVTNILGGPNSELADFIEVECREKSWEASETLFGINMNPLCKPQDVSYTFLPNFSYFEFLSADEGNKGEIVDLVNVKLGCYYEPLVTNYYGLHRYKMGDILQVSGFYNSAPQFSLPGHYVFYWELKGKNIDDIVTLDKKVMVECCCVMEESFDVMYRKNRRKDGSIRALEIRVVQQGTFESVMDYFISKGASPSQYKTPLCINSPEVLAILEDTVLARFFSDKSPPI